MTLQDIAEIRLASQQLESTKYKTVKQLVGFMCAMQAQDYNMAKYAIGVRLPQTTGKTVEKAIDRGDIIRTHALRATWHFVAAEDIYWMLALSADRIKQQLNTRHKQLNLSEKDFTKSNRIMVKLLEGGHHITREEIIVKLEKAGIGITENRSSHILLRAELDGLICRGKVISNKHTYTLLEEWIKPGKTITREEALSKLAYKYFSSHGPATLGDFIWWSGLPIKEARHALEMVKPVFISEKVQSETFWFAGKYAALKSPSTSVHLLPAFDEFIISYKDRTASLATQHFRKVATANGIFWPIVVINGQVTGLWKRSFEKNKMIIETAYFNSHNKTIRKLIDQKVEALGNFSGMETVLLHK